MISGLSARAVPYGLAAGLIAGFSQRCITPQVLVSPRSSLYCTCLRKTCFAPCLIADNNRLIE